MCGRYAVSQSADDLADEFGVDRVDVRERLQPDWNIAPSKQVYAVLTRGRKDESEAPPERRLRTLKWGLVPSWAKDASIGNKLVNARVETAAEKPAFRRAFAARRCLLPADGFYEWRGEKKGQKQPFFIHPKDGSLAMAGLYEIWRDKSRPEDDPDAFLWSVVILTTDATDDVGQIHDRMPMLVEPDKWEQWLDPGRTKPAELGGLLTPAVPGILDAYPVSTEVNRVANNGPQLVEPVKL
ncbi:SOS response-associated peptidase [Jiangella asiatica]|uniref:Abasic site processing protein n=1 Tax=Jiangella asiatica TaxID=2530372 RepID=A0A4R5DLH8_9ACTN|nr:SOS response-associated peptidase [Jiangella asiatica]TDE14949.1 SOS response-associated peptidase [Jiangella asiatica]